MPTPVDWKFHIDATALHNGKTYTEESSVLFLCKDKALPKTLFYYRAVCVELGCEADQLRAIDLLIERVTAWQEAHPELLKVADIDGDEAMVPPKVQTLREDLKHEREILAVKHKIRESVTRQEVIDLLSEMLTLDPEATTKLCVVRIPCSDTFVTHPSLQVAKIGEESDGTAIWGIGLIGVLNGLFGANASGVGDIAMIVDRTDSSDDEQWQRVIGFRLMGRRD